MSDTFTSRVVSPHDLEPVEVSAWEELCATSTSVHSPFFSPHFALAVASVHPGVKICVLRKAGHPVGFLPFQYSSRWHRWLAAAGPVGGQMNDYFGLIAEPDVYIGSSRLLRLAGLRHLGFTHLDETQLNFGLEGERPETGLRIQLAAGANGRWEQLRDRKKRFVEDTERRARKLESAHGPLRFQFAETSPAALAQLIRMKRLQYASTNVRDSLAQEWKRKLLENLAGVKEPTCSGILSVLYAGETWVASHFGLRSKTVMHYWFPVYNPDLREFAPGRLLLKHVCEAAPREGIRCIDRGAGDSQAKRDIANEQHLYYRGAWYQPGPRAAAVRALHSLKWRLGPIVNSRFGARTAGLGAPHSMYGN